MTQTLPITFTCPMCAYQFDLLSGLQQAEQSTYMKMIFNSKLSADEISLVMRYLVMFKPRVYALTFSTMQARTMQLLTLINSGRVSRGGDVRIAQRKDWIETITQLVTNKPENLKLPLKGHGYLEQMVWNQAEAAAAKAEAFREKEKQFEHRDYETGVKLSEQLKKTLNKSTEGNN